MEARWVRLRDEEDWAGCKEVMSASEAAGKEVNLKVFGVSQLNKSYGFKMGLCLKCLGAHHAKDCMIRT